MSVSTILSNLNGEPMFKMSLGSKELFHSNFLEYLWGVDSNSFKKMICDLLGDHKVFKSDVEYNNTSLQYFGKFLPLNIHF